MSEAMTEATTAEATDERRNPVINKMEVRRLLKEMDHLTANDFPDALQQQVEQLIRSAATRAAGNKRKLVKSCDL